MSDWVVKVALVWLSGVYEAIKWRLIHDHDVAAADETEVQVLNEEGRTARQKSYMWLYRSGADAAHPLVLYEYQQTRSASHPKAFLTDFKGYLHTDGYSRYHNLGSDITVVGCWAHARRRFADALTAIPRSQKVSSLAAQGLAYCDELFSLEHDFEQLSFTGRYLRRKELSEPVANAFFAWVNETSALPKSLIGKAIHYAREQRPYLLNVFLDGRCELSNNRSERSTKPFVLGRKNWLFSNTANGAEASAIIYSIVETAKENGLRAHDYLEYLFERLPNMKTSELADVMPWSEKLPDYIKVPKPSKPDSSDTQE